MPKCPVCGERAPRRRRGRSLQSAYTVSALVTELKLVQSDAGPEGAQAARLVSFGETLASEMHAWWHALPGLSEPDKTFAGEWIAGVDHLINETFLEGVEEDS